MRRIIEISVVRVNLRREQLFERDWRKFDGPSDWIEKLYGRNKRNFGRPSKLTER